MSKNYASKVIEIALNEVGYQEKKTNSNLNDKTANAGSNNYNKYASEIDAKYPTFYNGKKNGYDWCDIFVDWCFITAFGEEEAKRLLGQPSKSTGAGCGYSARFYKSMNRFYTSNPKVGDQIFFGNVKSVNHTGLVYKVDSNKVYTVEGNTSNGVNKKQYNLNYSGIYGYGRPAYDEEVIETKPNNTNTESNDKAVYTTHVVKKNETLTKIAKNYNTTVKALAELNSIENVNLIKIGDKLTVPVKKVTTSTSTPTVEPIASSTNSTTTEQFDKEYRYGKTYTVNSANGLYLRKGYGQSYGSKCCMANGTKVKWYGYYKVIDGIVWRKVQVASGTYKGQLGYCSAQYLK